MWKTYYNKEVTTAGIRGKCPRKNMSELRLRPSRAAVAVNLIDIILKKY